LDRQKVHLLPVFVGRPAGDVVELIGAEKREASLSGRKTLPHDEVGQALDEHGELPQGLGDQTLDEPPHSAENKSQNEQGGKKAAHPRPLQERNEAMGGEYLA
jgi:hypothetical protein